MDSTEDTTTATNGGGETTTEQQSQEFIRDSILELDEMKKIYIGNIPKDSTEEEVKSLLEEKSQGGQVKEVSLYERPKGDSKYGFAIFEVCEQADELLLNRSELKIQDKELDVKRAIPKNAETAGSFQKTKKLFIANLPKFECTEESVKEYFDQRHNPKYGIIESVQLIKKKDQEGNKMEENKGYGFVIVSSEDMADKMAIQHSTFEFGGRKIELKKSVPSNKGGRGGGGGYNSGYGSETYGGMGYGWGAGYGGDWGQYNPYAAPYGYGPPPPYGARGRGGRFKPY